MFVSRRFEALRVEHLYVHKYGLQAPYGHSPAPWDPIWFRHPSFRPAAGWSRWRPPPGGDFEEIREQDRFLPIANIARIMKNTLPENAKIAKDAKETVQECVSEFISFITSEASDKCMHEKRKTINGDDLLWAMSTLGFDKYVEPLKIYLAKYREAVKGEKPEKNGKKKKGGHDMDY